MHNAFGVRGLKRVRNLDCHGQQFFHLYRVAAYHLQQGLAFQPLHDDEVLALILLDGMDGTDIRMVQGRRCPGLTLKAFQGLRVLGHILREELKRYIAAKENVLGFVNHPHAAAAELAQDFVMRNGLSDHHLIHCHMVGV
jgi:hypothetical protein